MTFIKPFETISLDAIALVGGKNASLGFLTQQLTPLGIKVPPGFAVTTQGFLSHLATNNIKHTLDKALNDYYQGTCSLETCSRIIRDAIEQAPLPQELAEAIRQGYQELCVKTGTKNLAVAVRSSATAEDLPTASFAGQQESFLNVIGIDAVLDAYRQCIASLYTPRAIVYREEQQLQQTDVTVAVAIQQMIDAQAAGVAFTLDTETGHNDVVFINGAWGLGEAVVQGMVNPDSVYVHKPTLNKGFTPIIKKRTSAKQQQIVYNANGGTNLVAVAPELHNTFCISDTTILDLARQCIQIEEHYSIYNKQHCSMDIEWVQEKETGALFIVQARPETVHAHTKQELIRYRLQDAPPKPLLTGQSVGQKIVSGIAKIINCAADSTAIQPGDILITTMTDPDWVPAMKKAAGIITNTGGRTCHTAIVSRELGIPAIIGTLNATTTVQNGQRITLDCSQGSTGFVYEGIIPFTTETEVVHQTNKLPVDLMLNVGDPDQAFALALLPSDGVGLARLEFIINNTVGIHPLALIHTNKTDAATQAKINEKTNHHTSPQEFFINTVAQEAATIAAAFYPRPVVIRLSDFKSNEYRNLLGGSFFEPEEENPMIGLRGASRYYSSFYQEAFLLECQAMKKIRDEMGFTNVKLMIPFVRTVQEAHNVLSIMSNCGLTQGVNDLKIIMMCEIPSNVILIDQFSKLFDGFSIGSNDLTQLTLGLDRDSAELAHLFDECNDAVIAMLTLAIDGAQRNGRPIGICGQGPSDHPALAQFLLEQGINSISLNHDTLLPFITQHEVQITATHSDKNQPHAH